jgi:D-alanyl-D-alanine carboxypeptidase
MEEMNKKAKELNLCNTKYMNPHGLINKLNKSTTNDQARLSSIAM